MPKPLQTVVDALKQGLPRNEAVVGCIPPRKESLCNDYDFMALRHVVERAPRDSELPPE